jgi:hypothetical protein
MVACLKGNTGAATKLVHQGIRPRRRPATLAVSAVTWARSSRASGPHGYAPLALGYVDRASKFASEYPETGFPFVAYSSKVQTLLTLKQPDEAKRFAKTAMTEAKAGDRRSGRKNSR